MFLFLPTSNPASKYHFQYLHYHFQGSALSLPGTCIIASKDLHYCLRGPALLLQDLHFTSRTCIIASRDLHYCLWGPAFSPPGPALLLPDLHSWFWTCIFTSGTCIITSITCIIASGPASFYRNSSVQLIKTNRRKWTFIFTSFGRIFKWNGANGCFCPYGPPPGSIFLVE